MRKQKGHTQTIFKRMCIPIFLLLLLLIGTFYVVVVRGVIAGTLRQNAVDALQGQVSNRAGELNALWGSEWTNLGYYMDSLDALYQQAGIQGEDDTFDSPEAEKNYLLRAEHALIQMLRHTGVNGVFLILNDPLENAQPGVEQYYGLSIRDLDVSSEHLGYEDLLLERAPASLVDQLGCILDSWWEPVYTFANTTEGDFFYQPLSAAYQSPGADSTDLAYLSPVHHISGSDPAVLSYSLPLLRQDGTPYAVLGVELTVSRLSQLLPSGELNQNGAFYALVSYSADDTDYTVLACDGVLYERYWTTGSVLAPTALQGDGLFTVRTEDGKAFTGSLQEIQTTRSNAFFSDRHLALIGLVEDDALFSLERKICYTTALYLLLCLLLGWAGMLVVNHQVAKPIRRLAQRVEQRNAASAPALERLNIAEIDQLVDALETAGRDVAASRARSEFFSRMSHDMRTPMNAIIGFSSAEYLEGTGEAQKTDALRRIHSVGLYLLELINEVLDITKLESNKMALRSDPVLPQELWANVRSILDQNAADKGVQLRVDIEPELRPVLCDPQRLTQIFLNLLSNAVKFTPAGGTVTLQVQTVSRTEDRILRRVRVQDTGIGMSEEFQKKLYDPFAQEHPDRDGSGLGLSITKNLVELMGGTIRCSSAPGRGTTFVVELGLPLCPNPTEETPAAAPAADWSILQGKRVLLCEDHPLNMQIATALLKKQGVVVDVAQNGQEGLERYLQGGPQHYAAILMDIRMPVMDGLEATRAIRASSQADADYIPILAMTANAFAEDIQSTREAGMNAHLSKPIDPSLLYQTLADALAGHLPLSR